jgi:hypothetical protein
MAAIGDGAEGGFGQACRPEVAVVVFEQSCSDQPFGGRVLCGAAETPALRQAFGGASRRRAF